MLFINTGSCSGKHHHDAGKDLKNQLKRKKKSNVKNQISVGD